MELMYVFGDYDNRSGWWAFTGGLVRQPGAKAAGDPGLTDADRRVSEIMMKIWTQFARTGNPNIEGVAQWPVYEAEGDRYMYFADPPEVRSGFSGIVPPK
jgi:carboxylesterase type B